ncbi:MAG: helix-turn-helix transcriptional regulator [Bacteroidetes bacterium]|nr:helix-turn-helix transcriptional regulator [Bacteroidota bacterium]
MNMRTANANPLVFNYRQGDYEQWITTFGQFLDITPTQNKIEYPKHIADGYAAAKVIEPGLSYRTVQYTLNLDVAYHRQPTNELHIILYFYELFFEEKVSFTAGNTLIESNDKYYSIALMTNSTVSQSLQLKKGTTVRGVSVQLSEAWLKENTRDFSTAKLETIRQKDCVTGFINAKHRNLVNEILDNAGNSFFPELFIKSRVLRLTEQFLTGVCARGLHHSTPLSNPKDFQALVKVEHLLLKNFSADFPSIESLAKTAYMSESKLKKLFKKAYGMAIYQYYQKNRMHKAKELLVSRKHSVSQVGAMLGYQNMSNFSAAFKKEFSCLPSEVDELM